MKSGLYPLGCPVIVDALAYDREDRNWSSDPEPHQYVGTVSGTATIFNDGWPTTLYVVTLCSPDRFEDTKRPNGAHVSNLLCHESSLLHDARGVEP